MGWCSVCFRRGREVRLGLWLGVCGLCWEELRELELAGTSLYRYEGVVRGLVLRAKVQGDHRALVLLGELVRRSARVGEMAAWCDGVVAAPSSLWGRLRGRLDLAAYLAEVVAASVPASRPLVPAPLHLFWRLRKHALLSRAERGEAGRRELPPWLVHVSLRRFERHAGERLLLVDDVVTSGETLRSLRNALAEDGRQLRVLTLAAAKETAW